MTSLHDKAKQRGPLQFSLALLFLVVTISALFSAIWLRKPPSRSLYLYDAVDPEHPRTEDPLDR